MYRKLSIAPTSQGRQFFSKILFSVSQIKIYFSTDKSTSPLKANSRKSEPVQKIKQWCRKVKL